MNRIFLTTVLAAGLANNLVGQGLFLSNIGNTGGLLATSSGLVYWGDTRPFGLADLYNNNLGVEISYGLTSDSLSPLGLGTYTAATDPKGYTAWNIGQFYLGNVGERTVIPGAAAGGTVWIQLNAWLDSPYGDPVRYNSYAAAVAADELHTLTPVLWQQTLDNAGGSPPSPPEGFTQMPFFILLIPEPSTFALAGLGMGAVWLLRHRK